MYPPEGCPPLAGRKRHACHSPPQPVFCPDRPRPLDPGCAAKPHYTVPDRAGLPSLPGRGTRGGVADPSPVRQPAGSSRRMPRFGASREDPRKAPCAYPFGLGPNGCCHKTPLHSARTDRCTRLAGGVLTRGGHCRPSCGVRRAAVAALAALRACARKPRVGAFWSGTQNAAHL